MSDRTEQFQQRSRSMSDEELIELCDNSLSQLCRTGGRSFRMTIPPKATDTDMIFSELIRRYAEKTIKPESK